MFKDRKSIILRVWAAPGAPETLANGLRAPRAAQTPKMTDLRPLTNLKLPAKVQPRFGGEDGPEIAHGRPAWGRCLHVRDRRGTEGYAQPRAYTWVLITSFLGRPEICDFRGLGGPGGPEKTIPEGGGAKPTAFWAGVCGRRGRPKPKNRRCEAGPKTRY